MVKSNNHQTKTPLKGSKLVLNINSHENKARFLVCEELFSNEFFMMQLKPLFHVSLIDARTFIDVSGQNGLGKKVFEVFV